MGMKNSHRCKVNSRNLELPLNERDVIILICIRKIVGEYRTRAKAA